MVGATSIGMAVMDERVDQFFFRRFAQQDQPPHRREQSGCRPLQSPARATNVQ